MARSRGSLLPLSRSHLPAHWSEGIESLPALRREMDRLFDDFFTGFGFPWLGRGEERMLTPQIEVSESDQEIQIAAELPGLDEKDIEVTVADDTLTIRGEKKEESERKEHNVHMTERSYGTFSRTLRLPFAVDAGQAKAAFKDGVLRITIPKPKEVQQRTHKIEVRREDSSPGTAAHPASETAAHSATARGRQASEQKTSETAAE
jgi:HSP20 family protein